MSPKEKADELLWRFLLVEQNKNYDRNKIKSFLLITINEICQTNLIFGRYEYEENPEFFYSYWEEVKQEIEKL